MNAGRENRVGESFFSCVVPLVLIDCPYLGLHITDNTMYIDDHEAPCDREFLRGKATCRGHVRAGGGVRHVGGGR